jgi:hypothetical protein
MPRPIPLKPPAESSDPREALINRLAAMPTSTEDLLSTWCPPDWEEVVAWYDEFVSEARAISPNRYRS